MRNRFPDWCYRCKLWCEAGAGHFEKRRDGPGFRVQHAECAIAHRGEKFKTWPKKQKQQQKKREKDHAKQR